MRSISTAAVVACLSVLAACETVPSDGGGSAPVLNGVDLGRPVRALGGMNEPAFLEAGRVMAARVLRGKRDNAARLSLAYELTMRR